MRIVLFLADNCMNGFDDKFNPNHFFFTYKSWFSTENFAGEFTNNPEIFIPAGNIVNAYCKQYDLNQRIVIASLQREQGLVQKSSKEEIPPDHYIDYTDPITGEVKHYEINPVDWALGVGVPDDGNINTKYEGFQTQIKAACQTYRHWFNNFTNGEQITMYDTNEVVIAANACSASLLHYTPHVESGELTAKIYDRYFPG